MCGAVGSRCISPCDAAQSWDLLLRHTVHVIGSRAEDKHAVWNQLLEKASIVAES